jgi:hypothetical protein
MPAATTISIVANTAIAHSDMVFPSNLLDYDTNAFSFTLSVNITLAMPSASSSAAGTANTSVITSLSPSILPAKPSLCNLYAYKAYMAINGNSYMFID